MGRLKTTLINSQQNVVYSHLKRKSLEIVTILFKMKSYMITLHITLLIILVYVSMDYTAMAKPKRRYYVIETEDEHEDLDMKDNAQDYSKLLLNIFICCTFSTVIV